MRKSAVIMLSLCFSAQLVLAAPAMKTYDESEFDSPVANDPFEKWNRKIFTFNKGMDVVIFHPVDKIYRSTTPSVFRKMVHNVVNNFREPLNFINGMVQLDPKKAFNAMGRFMVNTTWGIGGVNDVAGYAGMKYQEESFGKHTLKKYKMKPGPYIMMPLLGPSSIRDSIGIGADLLMDPFNYKFNRDATNVKTGVVMLDAKDQTIDLLMRLEHASLDDYATLRSLYTQKYR